MGILIRPLVTEKVSSQNEAGRYGFVVDKNANKVQIKNEVEKTYGVTVASVNTMVYPGKDKTKYTKSRIIAGRTSAYKKAIITVADGEVIDFYSEI
jgi:large subunit ribosomal protein L23